MAEFTFAKSEILDHYPDLTEEQVDEVYYDMCKNLDHTVSEQLGYMVSKAQKQE